MHRQFPGPSQPASQSPFHSLPGKFERTNVKLSLRLILSLVVGITLVTFIVARNQVRSEKRGLRIDLERRAEILAESLDEIIEPAVESGSRAQVRHIVEKFGNRDRLAGLVVYDAQGNVLAESSHLV